LLLIAALALITGCEEERNVAAKPKAQAQAQGQSKPSTPGAEGFIVGRRTQVIKNATTEIKKTGAEVVTPKITAKDPITLQGNAYVSSIGKLSILQIEEAMKIYQATNDRYPKNYDEFMAEIIKANNIALPVLPSYQNYGYDEKEHKLVILEYPELKDQPAPR
jgi:hypothetical protein